MINIVTTALICGVVIVLVLVIAQYKTISLKIGNWFEIKTEK